MIFEHRRALPEAASEVNERLGNAGGPSEAAIGDRPANRQIRKDPFRSTPCRIGYVRVSTPNQQTDRQILQLRTECDELRIEHISAVAAERPVFDTLMRDLSAGDTVVVLDLDRAFRSAIDAILTAQHLRDRQIKLHVLSFPIDTTSEEGELFYGILALFAEFERRIISRRTKEGLDAARKRGVQLGRPPRLDPETILAAHDWMSESGLPCAYVAALLGVSRLTLQRGFRKSGLAYPIL